MTAAGPRRGYCPWCRRTRADVTVVRFIEQGSGPGASLYGCLEHARSQIGAPDAPASLGRTVAAMERRAADGEEGNGE